MSSSNWLTSFIVYSSYTAFVTTTALLASGSENCLLIEFSVLILLNSISDLLSGLVLTAR